MINNVAVRGYGGALLIILIVFSLFSAVSLLSSKVTGKADLLLWAAPNSKFVDAVRYVFYSTAGLAALAVAILMGMESLCEECRCSSYRMSTATNPRKKMPHQLHA